MNDSEDLEKTEVETDVSKENEDLATDSQETKPEDTSKTDEVTDIEVETRFTDEKDSEKDKDEEDEDLFGENKKSVKNLPKEKLEELETKMDVDSFLRSNPEYDKYRSSIIKFALHGAYRNIPIHNIAAIVSHKDQQRLGAMKERETTKKVAETKGAGASYRSSKPTTTDWSKASKSDVDAKRAEIFGYNN